MQRFINNWETALTAPATIGATELSVPAEQAARLAGLGSGDYYELTLVEVAEGAEVAWEIVKVAGAVGGVLTVEREQDGTPSREWAEGSAISARLTAGALGRIHALMAELRGRVEALEGEPGGGQLITVNIGTSSAGVGYMVFNDVQYGSLSPTAVVTPGGIERAIKSLFVYGSPATLALAVAGEMAPESLVSVEAQGLGVLEFADAAYSGFDAEYGETYWEWTVADNEWLSGGTRTVRVLFADQ